MFEAACAGGVAGATEVDTDLSEDEEDSDEDDRYMEIVFFCYFSVHTRPSLPSLFPSLSTFVGFN